MTMDQETTKKECPDRPGCFMFTWYCQKCERRAECPAVRKP